jgi:hypothetical protein
MTLPSSEQGTIEHDFRKNQVGRTWYVPVLHQDRQVLTVTVGRTDAGTGANGGSIGGGGSGGTFPAMSQAKALQLAGTSTDPAVS